MPRLGVPGRIVLISGASGGYVDVLEGMRDVKTLAVCSCESLLVLPLAS